MQKLRAAAVVQEILEKVPNMPEDVQWHFIGHLQSNKAKSLVGESLNSLNTVDHPLGTGDFSTASMQSIKSMRCQCLVEAPASTCASLL